MLLVFTDRLDHGALYDAAGLLQNGSMADYLVPMSGEMSDIIVAHVETPTASSALGVPAALMNAINDALAPLDAAVCSQPFTPEKILRALGKVVG